MTSLLLAPVLVPLLLGGGALLMERVERRLLHPARHAAATRPVPGPSAAPAGRPRRLVPAEANLAG